MLLVKRNLSIAIIPVLPSFRWSSGRTPSICSTRPTICTGVDFRRLVKDACTLPRCTRKRNCPFVICGLRLYAWQSNLGFCSVKQICPLLNFVGMKVKIHQPKKSPRYCHTEPCWYGQMFLHYLHCYLGSLLLPLSVDRMWPRWIREISGLERSWHRPVVLPLDCEEIWQM